MDGNFRFVVYLIYIVILSLVNITFGSFMIPESESSSRVNYDYGKMNSYEFADSLKMNWIKKLSLNNSIRFPEGVVRDSVEESSSLSNWGVTGYFSIDVNPDL